MYVYVLASDVTSTMKNRQLRLRHVLVHDVTNTANIRQLPLEQVLEDLETKRHNGKSTTSTPWTVLDEKSCRWSVRTSRRKLSTCG